MSGSATLQRLESDANEVDIEAAVAVRGWAAAGTGVDDDACAERSYDE